MYVSEPQMLSLPRTVSLALALILGACSSRARLSSGTELSEFNASSPAVNAPQAEAASSESAPKPGRLSSGDLIGLASLEDKKLNGTFRIDFEGRLSLPYDVSIAKASDLTLPELSAKIRESYKPFFSGGRVSLEITLKQHRVWLDVRGLVQKPGKFLVDAQAGLDEVIAQAGGFLVGANVDEVRITQGSETRTVGLADFFGSGARGPEWRGGERLFFRPADGRNQFFDAGQAERSVQVLGEVRRPGVYAYRSGADFLEYLTQAQGPTAVSDLGRIEIIRGRIPQTKSVIVDFRDKNNIPTPQAGDVVIVHADRATPLERSMPVITGFSTLAGTILLLIIAL